MSGLHSVVVYAEPWVRDSHGAVLRPEGVGVLVTDVLIEPFIGWGVTLGGELVAVDHRLISRSAPAGPWTHLSWIDPQGRQRWFTVLGATANRRDTAMCPDRTVLLAEDT